jgi:hypothetical protein
MLRRLSFIEWSFSNTSETAVAVLLAAALLVAAIG